MKEVLRVRCPCCGMMPEMKTLLASSQNEPEVRLFVQKFGGKVAKEDKGDKVYQKKGRGSAPGYMEYEEVTEESKESVETMIQFFKDRIKKFMEG